MQLVAYGAQDVYLTGNPQVTFFKVSYRRHTNFSMEAIAQTFNGTADFGRTVQTTLSRNGDLLGRTYLYISLPSVKLATGDQFRWVNWVGHAALRSIDFEIGGQRIDRHYGDWLQIWYELTIPAGKKAGYAALVGNVPALTQLYTGPAVVPSATLHVPLQFFFNRNIGQCLPLIALQYHETKITVAFREANQVMYFVNGSGTTTVAPSLSSSGGDVQMWCDYIFLDTDERRRFAQASHEVLCEQLQFTGDESLSAGSTSQKIKLSFNHPVKELIWVVQKDDVVDPTNATVLSAIKGLQLWNYSTRADTTGFSGFISNGFDNGIVNTGASGVNSLFGSQLLTAASDVASSNADGTYNSNFNWYANSNATGTVGGGVVGLLDLGLNPVLKAKLILNGSDRFAERNGQYFNLVQPFQHHEATPAVGINVYSFAITPETQQPSGTCNFSRIDQAILSINLHPDTFISQLNGYATVGAKLRVYAVNYNVLRIMSGMGGLAYAN